MADLTREDLRAAVAAGHISEAQAADVLALAQMRAGQRMAEDEPFELFRGFADIFVAVGLSILFSGALGLSFLIGGPFGLLATMALAWFGARYFTLRRRMVLPSIVLLLAYAVASTATMNWLSVFLWSDGANQTLPRLFTLAGVALALIAWFRAFRLPFTMFLLGLTGLAMVVTVSKAINPAADLRQWSDAFDLSANGLAFGTLVFGLAALAGGLWFDLRDRFRLGRTAASGFWLHLLAAPALVNTFALSAMRMGPGTGYALLALSVLAAAFLALLIDRRSFLTAGIGYMVFLVGYASGGFDAPRSWAAVFFVSGIGLTALGTYWTELRGRLMRALPDFPGKSRLPPFSE